MADIDYIFNVSTGATFNNDEPKWFKNITGAPPEAPDECVIRTITFNSAASTEVYSVWCSLKNSFIGSFPCGPGVVTSGTRIKMNAPIPNQLQFQFYVPSDPSELGDTPIHVDVPISGNIMIHMDFIRYKRPAGQR